MYTYIYVCVYIYIYIYIYILNSLQNFAIVNSSRNLNQKYIMCNLSCIILKLLLVLASACQRNIFVILFLYKLEINSFHFFLFIPLESFLFNGFEFLKISPSTFFSSCFIIFMFFLRLSFYC